MGLNEEMNEKSIILEQYKVYSYAKEKFIDRQFATNKFYLVLNIVLLITTYLLSSFTPQYQPILVLSVIGFTTAIMWWMNIDSYQVLIKIKYANVLEYLETKLPESPYHKEFDDYRQIKRKNKLIIFPDFQKVLAVAIACVYFFAFSYGVSTLIRNQMLQF